MTQQYTRRCDGFASGTMAPPVLSLQSHAPQASDDEPFFQMDSLDFMWEGEDFGPFPVWSDEIDQGQMYNRPSAHLARIEAGSAYRSLVGQLPVGAIGASENRFVATRMEHLQMDYPVVGQFSRSVPVPVPASTSMPRPIAKRQTGAPFTAPSNQLQWASLPERDQEILTHEAGNTLPTTHNSMLLGIPSTSPFSTHSTQSPWSNQQNFAQHSGPTYAPSTPITPQSSFNLAPTTAFSSHTPSSTPPTSGSVMSHISFRVENAQDGDPQQRKQQHASPSAHQTQGSEQQDSTANLSTWAQGTYHILDRTSFGSLAPPTTPTTPRRRRASRSRTRSVAGTLACENCNKTFASRSERDHHARWHGPKDRVCADCGRAFVAGKDLRRHEKTHKPPEEAYEFFCSVQGCLYERRGFARKDHLARHWKTHVGVGGGGDDSSARAMSVSFPF